jgi:hypothetical protein
MFGLAGNGDGARANITGVKVPGSMPGKAKNGNQGIGKITRKDISGIVVTGADSSEQPVKDYLKKNSPPV